MQGKSLRVLKIEERKEKHRKEKEKKKKEKLRCCRIESWIISYIISLAVLVPCATIG